MMAALFCSCHQLFTGRAVDSSPDMVATATTQIYAMDCQG